MKKLFIAALILFSFASCDNDKTTTVNTDSDTLVVDSSSYGGTHADSVAVDSLVKENTPKK